MVWSSLNQQIKPLPDFERMTPVHMETWVKEGTDEELDACYREVMAVKRGCKPCEAENLKDLTDDELEARFSETEAKE
jgi:hypothetical protein